ncbi:hypothetical protein [Micromonospora sp. NPDC047730]|uniref:hypothetical protein n=1 Tax=Micromonospora sp. NPDC047730 TaxID=3364253 RepID=UPI003719B670
MNAETVAEIIRDFIDGEYADFHEANISARAEGDSVVISVGVVEQPTRRFRAVLVETDENGDPIANEHLGAAFYAGRADMLRRVLDEAETFRGLMKRRRYFNNANGVRRFVDYLRKQLGEEAP